MTRETNPPASAATRREGTWQDNSWNLNNSAADLIGAMREAGVEPKNPALVVLDGTLKRFAIEGDKPGRASGWLVGHNDSHPAARFGSWRTGIVRSWRADRYTPMSAAERADMACQQAERRARQDHEHKVAAKRAEGIWRESKPADPLFPYLEIKRVKALSARQRGDKLVLPLYDFDRWLHSLQFIDEYGGKKLLRGGKKRGHFIPVNGTMPADRVLICEGFATGATLAEIEPDSLVLAAIDAGNLESVAVGARERMPEAEIVVCADADPIGESKARTAAHSARAYVSIPEFPAGVTGTDYNDLAMGVANG